MLQVKILVNEELIECIIAERQEVFEKRNQIYTYKVGKKKIKHRYSDGAIKLAIKMLKLGENN